MCRYFLVGAGALNLGAGLVRDKRSQPMGAPPDLIAMMHYRFCFFPAANAR
jgi:hypothetical protein